MWSGHGGALTRLGANGLPWSLAAAMRPSKSMGVRQLGHAGVLEACAWVVDGMVMLYRMAMAAWRRCRVERFEL